MDQRFLVPCPERTTHQSKNERGDAHMRQSGLYKFIAVLLLLSALWPSLSWAEALRGVGIVITLMGQATVVRSAMPQQVLPLKFRDELFYRDRISTQERPIVRVLR